MHHPIHDLEVALKPKLRGLVHAWSIVPMAIAGLALVAFAPSSESRAAIAVYAFAITGMLAASASYHRLRVSDAARLRLRRLDHSMIGVAVAGTYTPVVTLVSTGALQFSLLALLWTGALGAMAVSFLWPEVPRWVRAGVYVLLGWAGAAVIPPLLSLGGPGALLLVLTGALLYSFGAVVYATRRPNPWPMTFGFHEVFHAFVVAAAAVHFGAVVLLVQQTS